MLKNFKKRNQGSQVPTTDENFSNQTQMIWEKSEALNTN